MRFLTNTIFCFFLFLVVACQPEPPKGTLRIDTNPPDVPLTINGKFVGNSPVGAGQYFAIELTEGEHVVDALIDIDKSKQLIAKKNIYVAQDTLQSITLKLEERLTPFGEEEKIQNTKNLQKEKATQLKIKKDNELVYQKIALSDLKAKVSATDTCSF